MREFKFRQWVEEFQEYITWEKMLGFENLVNYLNDEGVEQYTGIKDCNGVEIYEGDIVQPVKVNEMFGDKLIDHFGDMFTVECGNYVYGKWIAEDVSDDVFGVKNYNFTNEMLVLGNIHENPELIEVEDIEEIKHALHMVQKYEEHLDNESY